MTRQLQSNITHEAVQLLSVHGFEAMVQAIQMLMNEATRIERAHYLQADPYERSAGRRSPMPTDSNPKRSKAASVTFSCRYPKPEILSSIPRPWNVANAVKEL